MKILITGPTGFVGRHLCQELASEGHEVLALARSAEKFQGLNLQAHLVLGSLNPKNTNDWIHNLPDDLDTVIHIAGKVHAHNPKEFYDVNSHGTEQLIKDLAHRYSKLNFIYLSSQAAIGPDHYFNKNHDHIIEDDICSPVSEYGHSKLLGEIFLKDLSPHQWKKIIIRPPMVIGPGDDAIFSMFEMAYKGVFPLPGKNFLQKKFSFVCIKDLVRFIVQANDFLHHAHKDYILHVGYPFPITGETLAKEITQKVKSKRSSQDEIKLYFIPHWALSPLGWLSDFVFWLSRGKFDLRLTYDKAKELKQNSWFFSTQKSQELLQFEYQYDFSKTITKTWKEDYQFRFNEKNT